MATSRKPCKCKTSKFNLSELRQFKRIQISKLQISSIKDITEKTENYVCWLVTSETKNRWWQTISIVWWKITGYFSKPGNFLYKYLPKVSINENRKFEYTTRVTRENQNKFYHHLAAKKEIQISFHIVTGAFLPVYARVRTKALIELNEA
jgi:hypothetical protein